MGSGHGGASLRRRSQARSLGPNVGRGQSLPGGPGGPGTLGFLGGGQHCLRARASDTARAQMPALPTWLLPSGPYSSLLQGQGHAGPSSLWGGAGTWSPGGIHLTTVWSKGPLVSTPLAGGVVRWPLPGGYQPSPLPPSQGCAQGEWDSVCVGWGPTPKDKHDLSELPDPRMEEPFPQGEASARVTVEHCSSNRGQGLGCGAGTGGLRRPLRPLLGVAFKDRASTPSQASP